MYDMSISEDNTPIPQIEGQSGLLPDLTMWGIDPVEKGVCEDSFENRRILRENKSRWIAVYTTEGAPTNLIQVVTPEMRQASLTTNKSTILKNKKDHNSEYITGLALLLNPQAQDVVPAWVIAATQLWDTVEQKREETGKQYRPALMGPPQRCAASTIDGSRCARWTNGTVDSNGLCKVHISTHRYDEEDPGVNTLAKARHRIMSAAIGAVDKMEALLDATSEPVQLGAAKELLDRAGIRGGFDINSEVTVKVVPAADLVAERLKNLRANTEKAQSMLTEIANAEEAEADAANTVTAEIVEDES